MTYLQYHLVFILPVLLLLALVSWRETRNGRSLAGAFRKQKWAWRTLILFPLIPLIYTTLFRSASTPGSAPSPHCAPTRP